MDAQEALAKKVVVTRDNLLAALSGPTFYIELGLAFTAILLGGLLAISLRRRLTEHLHAHPPKRIDAEFIIKPLALLGPLLVLLMLSVAKPFSDEYAQSTIVIGAAIQLTAAYLMARIVLMVVRSQPVAYLIAGVIIVTAVLDVTGFMKTTAAFLDAMDFEVGKFKISLLNLIHGIIIFVIVFWGAALLARTLESYLRRSSSLGYNTRELIVKFFRIFVYFVAFMITLSAMGVDLTAFAVFGGALGVGIGLGLQKITANFVSGVTLLMEKSIELGDIIEVSGQTGTVRQLNIRYALIETTDGREILIPNEELMSTRVTNWTHSSDKARVDVTVPVAYGMDAVKARDLMIEAARQHPLCQKNPAPSCFLREFGQLGMNFLLTFWIPDVKDGRMGPQSEVMLAVIEKFKTAGIKMPFTPPPDVKVV